MPKKTKNAAKAKIDTRMIAQTLRSVQRKLRNRQKFSGREPTRAEVNAARDIAHRLQELNRGLRESIKHAMFATGKLKPGQVLTVRDRRVFLKLRPGAKEGSKKPDDYDLVYELIH